MNNGRQTLRQMSDDDIRWEMDREIEKEQQSRNFGMTKIQKSIMNEINRRGITTTV